MRLYSRPITVIGFAGFILLTLAALGLAVDERGAPSLTPGAAMAGLAAVVAWFVMIFGITGPRGGGR